MGTKMVARNIALNGWDGPAAITVEARKDLRDALDARRLTGQELEGFARALGLLRDQECTTSDDYRWRHGLKFELSVGVYLIILIPWPSQEGSDRDILVYTRGLASSSQHPDGFVRRLAAILRH